MFISFATIPERIFSMNKNIYIKFYLAVFFSFLNYGFIMAQSSEVSDTTRAVIRKHSILSDEKMNTWDICGHLGFTFPSTDIAGTAKLAVGADLTKFLSHNFAIQARLMHASLAGKDAKQPNYLYNTTVAYDLSLNAIVQIGNFNFLPGSTNVAVYGSAGFGIMHYSPHVYIDGGQIPLKGIYSQYTAPFVISDYENSTDFVIPFGIGAKYKLKDKYSFRMEYSVKRTYSDKLDGFFKLLSADDYYSYFNLGVVYQIGSEKKDLQWSNPLQTAYDDLYKIREEIDELKRDSDQDGVVDIYDKDSHTPVGVKVYGDGTAVDTDDDGVPDYKDSEIYSSKYAIVDATGKEIAEKSRQPVPAQRQSNETINDNSANSKKTETINIVKPAEIIVVKKSGSENNQIKETDLKNSNTAVPLIQEPVKAPPVNPPAENPLPVNNEPVTPVAVNTVPVVTNPVVPVPVEITDTEIYSIDSMPSINFNVREEKISQRHFQTLKSIAKIMKDNPGVDFRVVGIYDMRGDQDFNRSLCRRRAEAVKSYLVRVHKVNSFRLTVESLRINSLPGVDIRRVDILKK